MSRKQGFNGADGENGESEITANQAFNKYLEVNNIPKTGETKALFKKWIEDCKADGTLSKIVTSKPATLEKAIAESAPVVSPPTADSITAKGNTTSETAVTAPTTTIMGFSPVVFGIGCFVAGAVALKVYQYYSKK